MLLKFGNTMDFSTEMYFEIELNFVKKKNKNTHIEKKFFF